jgi:hypothetical protein
MLKYKELQLVSCSRTVAPGHGIYKTIQTPLRLLVRLGQLLMGLGQPLMGCFKPFVGCGEPFQSFRNPI